VGIQSYKAARANLVDAFKRIMKAHVKFSSSTRTLSSLLPLVRPPEDGGLVEGILKYFLLKINN
jgi:hypothetical protein